MHEDRLEAHEERVAQAVKNSEGLGMVNNAKDAQNVEPQ